MKVIGMCGGSGSGKGLACSYFNELGIRVIDTDRVYHSLTSSFTDCLREISDCFGDGIVKDGRLDRASLANIVFSSKEKLDALNAIAHKHILSEVRKKIDIYRSKGERGVIIDAPVLFESGFDKECDAALVVYADVDVRVSRIMRRDGISREKALLRIQSQKSDAWLIARCDYSIENSGTPDELKRKVTELAKKIFDI